MLKMMTFQYCSSTSILVEKCFKNAKFEGNARGKMCVAPRLHKRHFLLTPLVAITPRPSPSNLKTKEETSWEITPTKGDIFTPPVHNECILSDIDLPLS